MPKGGHLGAKFPVCGVRHGPNSIYKKPGLYHLVRTDILTPRWGFRRETRNPTRFPAPGHGSQNFSPDIREAWPLSKRTPQENLGYVWRVEVPYNKTPEAHQRERWMRVYSTTEKRYRLPAERAVRPDRKLYILDMLERFHGRAHSGMGTPGSWDTKKDPDEGKGKGKKEKESDPDEVETITDDQGGERERKASGGGGGGGASDRSVEAQYSHVATIAIEAYEKSRGTAEAEEALSVLQRVLSSSSSLSTDASVLENSSKFEKGRISRLWRLVRECDLFRNAAPRGARASSRPFPHVVENASVVRDLSLAEILYTKSNLRLKCRNHPIHMYRKWIRKQEKKSYMFRRGMWAWEEKKRALRSFAGGTATGGANPGG
uniref:Uncharacterized protein n=1 Tax=Chromera velia CCMP2878 TaxID=1169474 RepID=A0A0G4I334_9ALVE|eukprot:Cvel_1736.t1-p1 / transcript=Cvel_1736.t1 / gene=Cvel_1736 / organism=Chromera_velia_CCMP2878 / gene_product=hypothetical protein / transcript_product=hypothetical protein / location=Cvel_scaffold63:60850-62955(-) / protein_length=374 / sequence_SO=supercontig / SO=protein_coding / is_pseudo=false